MAKTSSQERLAAARKRARDKLAEERQTIEDGVLRYHRAAVSIEELQAQIVDAELERTEAVKGLLATGRSIQQVADLLGVDEADLDGAAASNGKRRPARVATA